MASITIDQVVPGEIDINDLTEVKLDGTGVWDKLLQNMNLLLDKQFDYNRITGPSYAQVYSSTYESTLNAAITLLLSKEKLALEITGLQLDNQLKTQQIAQAVAQTENIEADTALKNYQYQYLYPAQLEQANKQLDLLDAQIAVQEQQVQLLIEQVKQAEAQSAYYAQKTITEKAQVDGSVIGADSVIGVQIDLMKAQTDGYARNAEQQAATIFANTWNVRRQTDDGTSANAENLLDDDSIGKVMQQLAEGIGVTLTQS